MPRELTIGVLSPFLGGWYFGGILKGIVRAAARADANVVAIQTLDAGTELLEVNDPPDLAAPIALQHVAGFVIVINATTPQSLAAIRDAGKPIVAISRELPGIDDPVVLPDNRSGVREAVTHLIEHGHRRISFAGYLGVDDVRQRYDVYRETLQAYGITPDPHLFYAAEDNQYAGGEAVARAMMAAGLPSTAVMAGCDANALGIIRTLGAAGYRLPHDQAVIGFDDVQAGAYATPRLSSVKQPFEAVGATAVEALLERVRGDVTGPGRRPVPTSLVVRESCGCAGPPAHAAGALDDPSKINSPERLAETARQVHDASLRAAAAQHDAHATRQIAERAGSTILDLMQAQGRMQFNDRAYLEETLGKQYEVSMELLRGHEEDPRQLRWLTRTSVSAGCLGLWSEGDPAAAGSAELHIAGTFLREGPQRSRPGQTLRATAFPPAELITAAEQRADALTFVVPVKVGTSDWGLLAIADAVDTRVGTGREPVNHWAALLTVALDRQAVLNELHQREEELRAAALYDHLTGLPNRTLFLDRLRQTIERTQRDPDRHFGVLFVDLDGFKIINDSMGHAAGDKLLVLVAQRFQDVLRASDTAARYGGDEFLVLLDGTDEPNTPTRVAERLHVALTQPFHVDGQELMVSASIGIVVGGSGDERAEDLLRDADIAMYSAKSQRKGSHVIFDAKMHAKAVSRLQIETEFRHALERQEFEVYYQPIVHLRTKRVVGYEALVRWRHPERGMLDAAEFLNVAEETGLIVPVGRWVVDHACRQLAAWPDDGQSKTWVSVNVSHRQFWHEGFVDDIAACVRSHRLDPKRLALEITESVIASDVERARGILQGLGCRVLIDDVGTGYSTIEVLYLPIDGLKIHQALVSRLDSDNRSRDLLRTIVTIAGDLDLIAEGIETDRQRDLLIELGCVYGQGYLLSRPRPPHQPTTLLTTPTASGLRLGQM